MVPERNGTYYRDDARDIRGKVGPEQISIAKNAWCLENKSQDVGDLCDRGN